MFRCNNCETINEIPSDFRYRFCKGCGKITTYHAGESIVFNDIHGIYKQFLDAKLLSQKLAERFFELADSNENQIIKIIAEHEKKHIDFLDLPAATLADTVLFILRNSEVNTLDNLIQNCLLFNIPISKMEKIILQMKNEGLIYQPQSWLIYLI